MKVATALLFVVAALSLIGCGDKGSGDAKPAAAGSGTAAAGTAKPAGTGTGGW